MSDLVATDRVIPNNQTNAVNGSVVVIHFKLVWYFLHALLSVLAVSVFWSWGAVIVSAGLTAVTVCAGHSVGMHRLLIHRSFECPKVLEYVLVWLGTLVGMAGPFGMIQTHDMRDWHQRQAICAPHPSHKAGFWKDAWWQLCCNFQLCDPPTLSIEPEVANDPVYIWMERTWMAQQLPLAVLLFACGGWGWVLWGISVRIFVSLTGHWMVGHFAHKSGSQGWRVDGVAVQGFNLPWLGLLTAGENWHGNHHAFPHSAKLGVEDRQADPGYWLIQLLSWSGLAWNTRLPDSEPARDGLVRLG